jgi:hypothetical protein
MKRLKLERVRPLEVWDWPVDGRPLQAYRSEPGFPDALAEMVTGVKRQAAAFTHVYLAGGGVTPALVNALEQAGFAVTPSVDPVFGAVRAGARLLPGGAALSVDLGQTSIKLIRGGRAHRVERDLQRAPRRAEVPAAAWQAARASTVRFLAEALADAPAPSVVLALPCELDADGVPSGSTYCWAQPDCMLLADLAGEAGLPPTALHVLNDAELAAVAADQDPRVPRTGASLVLTIGFGVGGAVLDRAPGTARRL